MSYYIYPYLNTPKFHPSTNILKSIKIRISMRCTNHQSMKLDMISEINRRHTNNIITEIPLGRRLLSTGHIELSYPPAATKGPHSPYHIVRWSKAYQINRTTWDNGTRIYTTCFNIFTSCNIYVSTIYVTCFSCFVMSFPDDCSVWMFQWTPQADWISELNAFNDDIYGRN